MMDFQMQSPADQNGDPSVFFYRYGLCKTAKWDIM